MLHDYHLCAHHCVCLTAEKVCFGEWTHRPSHKDKRVNCRTDVISDVSAAKDKLPSYKHYKKISRRQT